MRVEAMTIFAHIRRSFRETFPTRASEWACAMILFLWSVVLNLNTELFTAGATYRALAGIATQETWGMLCLAAGGGRLVFLAVNGMWRRSPHLRALGAGVGSLFWFEITIGAIQGGAFATALAVYPVLFSLDIYNVIRAIGEAGRSDATHRRMTEDGNHS